MEYRAREPRRRLFSAVEAVKQAVRCVLGGDHWSDVRLALPAKYQEVLVLDDYNEYYLAEVRDDNLWYCTIGNNIMRGIKYWRRLPVTPTIAKLERWSALLEK